MSIEFILENGEKYTTNNHTKLLLLPDLLKNNITKIENYLRKKQQPLLESFEVTEQVENRVKSLNGSIKVKYDRVSNFSEGLAKISLNDQTGFINEKGEVVIPYSHNYGDFVGSFHNGLALLRRESKWGFINKKGRKQIPIIYTHANSFKEGLASVEKNNKWGFINKEGKSEIPFIYESAKNFNEDLAPVKKEDKWGYIDKNNQEIIPFIYDEACEFNNDIALVCLEDKWGVINKKGEEIVPCIYFTDAFINNCKTIVNINNNRLNYKNQYGTFQTIELSTLKEKILVKHITNLTQYCKENYLNMAFDLETNKIILVTSYDHNALLEKNSNKAKVLR